MSGSWARVCLSGFEQLEIFGKSEVAALLYVDELLDGKVFSRYLDIDRSVSALPEIEIDHDYCEFHKELNVS